MSGHSYPYGFDVFRQHIIAAGQEGPGLGSFNHGKPGARAEAGNEQAGLAGGLHQPVNIIGSLLRAFYLGGLCLPLEQDFGVAHGFERGQQLAAVALGVEPAFGFGGGIAQGEAHHEAVELGFGQGEGAELFDGVLGGDHEEGFGQAVGFAVYRNLFFLHGFQKGGLHFG